MYGATPARDPVQDNATKIDVNLNDKKKVENGPKSFYKNTDVLKIIQAEYSINHCSQEVRTLLCRGSTQEKIREQCEAYVSTKGRFIPPGPNIPTERSDKPFGLYLFIQGPNKRSIDLAISMIENIIGSEEVPRPAPLMSINTSAPPPTVTSQPQPQVPPPPQPNIHTMPPPPASVSLPLHSLMQMQVPPPAINLVEKLPIGIDRPLPGFNLPMKLIGQNGSNLQYIRNETGAVVTLRGIGSAFIEPTTGQEAREILHFSIEHSKTEGLAAARDFALNLITTVQQEYSQYIASQGGVQTVTMDQNMMMQQAPLDGQLIHQPMLTTSFTVPVVQTAAGIMQQPGVPPPQFSQPPPPQLSLPPPGVHIPPQSGPLPPPGVHIPAQQGPMMAGLPPPGPQGPQMAADAPGQQQQYVITQSGQPVQGIMTSQGFVVLNQQHQHQVHFSQSLGQGGKGITSVGITSHKVYLSQPPGQGGHLLHQGQFAIQSPGQGGVGTPVSYQLQYVQAPTMTMTNAPMGGHMQLQQGSQPQHTVVLQHSPQMQISNSGALHMPQQNQMMGMKPDQMNPNQLPPGHVVQMKSMPPMQLVQPYSPTVQYLSSPGVRNDQPVPSKEPRLGKRKFTEEAEPPNQQKQSPQVGSPNMQPPPPMQMQQQQQVFVSPQMLQQPPPHYQMQPHMNPQPVPHPSQTRQGVGMQDMVGLNVHERGDALTSVGGEHGLRDQGKGEGGGLNSPPPAPPQGNGQYSTPPPIESLKHNAPNQWYEGDQKARNEQQQQQPQPQQPPNEYENGSAAGNTYGRMDRPQKERTTFNHYSSKPQLYTYQPFMQPSVCVPPPPPPPSSAGMHPPQQQHYYYGRR